MIVKLFSAEFTISINWLKLFFISIRKGIESKNKKWYNNGVKKFDTNKVGLQNQP